MNARTGTAGRAATPAGNGGETAPAALRRQKMRAIVQDTHGAADVWRVEEIAWPEAAGYEVPTREGPGHRAGPGTWHLMVGEFTPVIDKTCPLHQAPGAMCYLEAGHAQGKARHHGDRRWMSRRESVFAVRERVGA
jgi:hypothetical protein